VPPPPPLPGGAINGMVSEVPVDDYDREPVLIRRVQPKVGDGAVGTVSVEVVILPNGRVSRATVLDQKSPYAEAARAAALQCIFEPARRRNKPVAVVYVLDFKLATK